MLKIKLTHKDYEKGPRCLYSGCPEHCIYSIQESRPNNCPFKKYNDANTKTLSVKS